MSDREVRERDARILESLTYLANRTDDVPDAVHRVYAAFDQLRYQEAEVLAVHVETDLRTALDLASRLVARIRAAKEAANDETVTR